MNAETSGAPFRLTDDQLREMFPGAEARFTADEMRATAGIIVAIGKAIRDLGGVPSGHLYAMLMSKMSLNLYLGVVAKLKQAGLVKESGHYLTWTGPKA